jgi:hypothetical protein
MEIKTTQRWQLQDVLHATGEVGITQSDYGDKDGDPMQARIEPVHAQLVGKVQTTLNLTTKTGLPTYLTRNECTFIWRAITGAMRRIRGGPPTLAWKQPITCASQLKRSLEDRQVHPDDDRRFRTVTLRSIPYYQNRPARDNVKVWIEEDAGPRLYFAMYVTIIAVHDRSPISETMIITMNVFFHAMRRCMAFFQDDEGDVFVALRWYAAPRVPPNGTLLELTGLNLARDNDSKSYSVLPEKCIVNGAVLLKSRGTYWAIQSPREELEYARNLLLFQM